MKRCWLGWSWISLVLLSAAGGAEPEMNRFELKRPLDGTFAEGEQGRITVADDLFGQARNFPDDVRLFGTDGIQWPWFLHTPKTAGGYTEVDLKVLNKSFVSGDAPCLQFDLSIPAVQGRPPVHNRLELLTSGHGFIRRVEIYTGEGEAAGLLATGYLIDFSRQRDARNRLVRYPDSDAKRLHVRIYPNAQSATETFDLRSASMRYYAEYEPEREHVLAEELDLPDREKEDGAQSFLFDLGAENRPAEFITFTVGKESYARCVSVFGRNTDHEPWKRVGGGEIHMLADDEDNEIKIRARHRFLKINVYHYDDRPLDIPDIRIEAVPRYLVFEAAGDGSAALYFRAWDVRAPRYDLAGRIDEAAVAGLPVIPTLDTEPNRSAKTQGWRQYSRLLAGVAVGAVSLLVIGIIVSMLRQQQTTGEM